MNKYAFTRKVGKYGQSVTIYWKPDTSNSNKCSCWENDYPDPDCSTCNGNGYLETNSPTLTKAFVQDFKKRIGERVIFAEGVDYIKSGRKRFYFKPEFVPLDMDYIVFMNSHYRVLEHGEWLISNTVVYTWATCEVID